MEGSEMVPGESDFAVLPSADHTYALDNFPTDEVPKVFAFEEVQSQTQMPQSFFSIVEEHAYAYRDQNMLADEWSNLPGMNTEPHGVDAATQTESVTSPGKEAVDDKEEYFKALAAVEKSIRTVSLTVSWQLVSALEAAASFLHLSVTVKGNRIRSTKISDLLRILMCAPKFSEPAVSASSKKESRTSSPPAASPAASLAPTPAPDLPRRDVSVLRSGRLASRFKMDELEEVLGTGSRGGGGGGGDPASAETRVAPSFVCSTCGLELSSQGCLTRHQKTVHGQDGRRFKCDRCPARYKRHDTLLEHVSTKHRGSGTARPSEKEKYMFRCKHCFRCFKRKTVLNDHMNSHTGNLAHVCKFCNQRFTARTVLCYHLKTRHCVSLALLRKTSP